MHDRKYAVPSQRRLPWTPSHELHLLIEERTKLNPVFFLHNLFLFSSFWSSLQQISGLLTPVDLYIKISSSFQQLSVKKVDRTCHKSANTQQTAFLKSLYYQTQLKRKSQRSERNKTDRIIHITLPAYITKILFF
jgi:hypothetical protein